MPSAFPGPAALIPALDGLPAPWSLMALLLFATFILHLVLMNAVVGVAIITLIAKLRVFAGSDPSASGDFTPDVLLPKGVALVVNFGIPPFLFLQCIFGQYIYASSVLMGLWWLSVMLVVMLAYYGFYINMNKQGISDAARTTALGLAVLLLMWNAFLFVNNMTLMQNPAHWTAYARNAGGTLLNCADPQVLPRWLHVMLSCLAVGGLALALPAALNLRRLVREGAGPAKALPYLESKRKALRWFFYATLLQIPVGAWFFMALPRAQRAIFMGGDLIATALFTASLSLSLVALVMAWRERAWCTAGCALLVVILMAGMRTLLRASLLEPYYSPHMRRFDPGPLLLFLGALVVSAFALAWLAKVYWRHKTPPGEPECEPIPAAAGQSAGLSADQERMREITRMREREALLVIELDYGGKDGEPDDEANGGTKA